MDASSESLSARLRGLTDELRTLDRELKSGPAPDSPVLQEFRHVLDNTRMTAWTVGELFNARATQKDPGTMLSFLTSERLRRFGQMVKDLCADIEQHGVTWQTHGIQVLFQYVSLLQERLGALIDKHRGRLEEVSDDGPRGQA
jgi:hypothetical protein